MAELIKSNIIDVQPKILSHHLSLCVDFILDEIDGVISIILTGGYGRGEGTWLRDNDVIQPYNDYDFVVIVNESLKKTEKEINTEQLALSLGISWIDIDIFSISQFRCLKPTVKNYDILNGSTVIYGNENIIGQANDILPSQITTKDLYIFYYTRAYTLLCCLPKGKKLNETNPEEMRYFRNQIAKGFLALQDCELISEYKFYCSSYAERTKFYSDHSSNLEKIKWYQWALLEKLDPCNNKFDLEFGFAAYEALINFYQTDMNKYLGKYFYRINVTLKNFELLEFTKPILLGKYILSKVFKSYAYLKKERALNHLQFILINTWPGSSHSERYEKYFPKVKKLVIEIEPNSRLQPTWDYVQNLIKESR